MKRALVWFRNDLRLHDNDTLTTAAEQADELLLVYCIDPRHFHELPIGFRKTGIHRARFLLESLLDLRQQIQQRGGHLVIRQGWPEKEIPQLVKESDIDEVYTQQEITSEEVQVEEALSKQLAPYQCPLHKRWGLTLYHLEDLPFEAEETPEPFKAFRHQGTKLSQVREEVTTPIRLSCVKDVSEGSLPTLDQLGFDEPSLMDSPFRGGETAGLERLQHYLFDTELLTTYKWTRNQSLGMDYSSKFSPWLAYGCLSPRRIYHAVKDYEQHVKKNISTYWLIFEMLWRDFFKLLGIKYGDKVFWRKGIYDKSVAWSENEKWFSAWCQGKTGIPFVDAHMTELNQVGFMSNRGRVNVSTYLTRDLEINWTWGASYFESLLIDYDVTSNWLNWYYQAVVWRYTHVLWQSTKYDPKGEYITNWLPQLSALPEDKVPITFLLNDQEQHQYQFLLGKDYPAPLLIPKAWEKMINRLNKQNVSTE